MSLTKAPKFRVDPPAVTKPEGPLTQLPSGLPEVYGPTGYEISGPEDEPASEEED